MTDSVTMVTESACAEFVDNQAGASPAGWTRWRNDPVAMVTKSLQL